MIMADDDLHIQTKLYRSVCNYNDNDDEVIEQCDVLKEKSLHYCTIYNSTVLHLACFCKRYKLANKLFDNLPEVLRSVLPFRINASGDTVLHEASTSNKGLELARKLLEAVPELLQMRNNWGETAVFRATRYGRGKVFSFLAQEVDKYCDSHVEADPLFSFQRTDGTTILHMAILTDNFDMAYDIARRYPELCGQPTKDKWTALQLLAGSPEAFKSGARMGLVKKFLYSRVSINKQDCTEDSGTIQKLLAFIIRNSITFWRSPIIEDVRRMKKTHADVLKLAECLVQFDTSWKDTHTPQAEITPVILNSDDTEPAPSSNDDKHSVRIMQTGEASSDDHETPLLLAARKGCIEIVSAILECFPQAVHHLNHNRENVLHVAVKSRNLEVFHFVKDHISSPKGLLGGVDLNNNSIQHMVGFPRELFFNPVLQLSDDLKLLEELEVNCPAYIMNHRNKELKTPYELYTINYKKLQDNAKKWLNRTAENNIVVIILIATVAFTAAYTVPGGQDEKGYPHLLGRPFFLVFTVTDVLSLGFAFTAVVVFLNLMSSTSFDLDEFRTSIPQKLFIGINLVFLSVTMMMVSFAATVILMANDRARWTKIALYTVAFFPISIFTVSYTTLYVNLAKATWSLFKKILRALPRPISCKHNSDSTPSQHARNSPEVQV